MTRTFPIKSWTDFLICVRKNDLTALHGFPPKIVWIRSGNLRTDEIADLLIKKLDAIQDFLKDDNLGCLEIIRLRKK